MTSSRSTYEILLRSYVFLNQSLGIDVVAQCWFVVQVDSPVPPGRKGMRYFLHGIDDHLFQSHREQLLEVGRNAIIDAAQTYELECVGFNIYVLLFILLGTGVIRGMTRGLATLQVTRSI